MDTPPESDLPPETETLFGADDTVAVGLLIRALWLLRRFSGKSFAITLAWDVEQNGYLLRVLNLGVFRGPTESHVLRQAILLHSANIHREAERLNAQLRRSKEAVETTRAVSTELLRTLGEKFFEERVATPSSQKNGRKFCTCGPDAECSRCSVTRSKIDPEDCEEFCEEFSEDFVEAPETEIPYSKDFVRKVTPRRTD